MSSLIPIFAFKEGMERAAEKVLFSHENVRPLGLSFPVQIQWKGKGAWTTFSVSPGADASGKFEKIRAVINYPAIPDAGTVTRAEADIFYGMELHELGHVLYTDQSVWASCRNGIVKSIANGLEDPRIECAILKSGKAPGSRRLFEQLLAWLLRPKKGKAPWNPNDRSNVAFTLAVLGRMVLYGADLPVLHRVWERMAPRPREFYRMAMEDLMKIGLDRSGTKDVLELANKLYAILKNDNIDVNPDPEDMPPPPPGEDGEDGGDSAPGEPSDPEDDDPEDDDPEDGDPEPDDDWVGPDQKPQEKKEVPEGYGDDDDEDGDDEDDDDGDPGYDGEDAEDGDDGDGDAEGSGDDEDGDDEDGDADGGDADGDGGEDADGDAPEVDPNADFSGGDDWGIGSGVPGQNDPDVSPDDIAKGINKREKAKGNPVSKYSPPSSVRVRIGDFR